MFALFLTGFLAGLMLPVTAHAQAISGIVSTVGNGLSMTFGSGSGPISIAFFIIHNIIWVIVAPIAVFIITRAGMSLINSQAEDKLTKAKQTIASTLIGLMLVYISQELVTSFFEVQVSGVQDGLPLQWSALLIFQITGIMNWVTTLMAVVGIAMIVVAGLRVISSFGKEEGITQMRTTVLGIAAGMILILIRPVINMTLGIDENAIAGSLNPSATPIIAEIAHIMANLLLFLALIAVSVVIYAGVMMIISFGNEEQLGKSRGLIFRAIIGLVVILMSYSLAAFVVSLVS